MRKTMDRTFRINRMRKIAWLLIHRREVRRRNILRPQDYQQDEKVVVYETSPAEAVRRLERFKAEREAGLR